MLNLLFFANHRLTMRAMQIGQFHWANVCVSSSDLLLGGWRAFRDVSRYLKHQQEYIVSLCVHVMMSAAVIYGEREVQTKIESAFAKWWRVHSNEKCTQSLRTTAGVQDCCCCTKLMLLFLLFLLLQGCWRKDMEAEGMTKVVVDGKKNKSRSSKYDARARVHFSLGSMLCCKLAHSALTYSHLSWSRQYINTIYRQTEPGEIHTHNFARWLVDCCAVGTNCHFSVVLIFFFSFFLNFFSVRQVPTSSISNSTLVEHCVSTVSVWALDNG